MSVQLLDKTRKINKLLFEPERLKENLSEKNGAIPDFVEPN